MFENRKYLEFSEMLRLCGLKTTLYYKYVNGLGHSQKTLLIPRGNGRLVRVTSIEDARAWREELLTFMSSR
jgi:hypothetical protein